VGASTAGTGKAGRELLRIIDEQTDLATPKARLFSRPRGRYCVGASRRAFNEATFATLADAGLIDRGYAEGIGDVVQLTAAGRRLLGA